MKGEDTRFKEVIDLVTSGSSLRAACKELKISSRTFYDIIGDDEEKKLQYARAKEERQDKLFEEILEIADDSSSDYMVDAQGLEKLNHEHVQRSKLKIDARKWMLGKMNPERYGDRTILDQNINERKQASDLFPDEDEIN